MEITPERKLAHTFFRNSDKTSVFLGKTPVSEYFCWRERSPFIKVSI